MPTVDFGEKAELTKYAIGNLKNATYWAVALICRKLNTSVTSAQPGYKLDTHSRFFLKKAKI